MERPNAWLSYSEADMNQLEDVAKKYRHFLNVGKTERECITQIVKEAEEAGYVSLEEKVKKGVDVRLLFDGMGCLTTLPADYERELRKKGIQCRCSIPLFQCFPLFTITGITEKSP